MGRWKKSKSFNPPALKGFKKKEDSAPVFNFSNHLIDAIDVEKGHDQFGGHFNEAFADLDEYGFTVKRRDTSGDITFKSAEAISKEENKLDSFSDLNAFGNITTAHEVEKYDSSLEVSEDKETGEKNVKIVYEVHPNVQPDAKKAEVDKGGTESKENVNESKQDLTSDSKQSVYSMDLDDLYKETHLPEREIPAKKSKKKPKRKESKDKKKKADDVVGKNAESPFVRSFRPSAVISSSEDISAIDTTDKNKTEVNHVGVNSHLDLPQVHSNGFVPKEKNNNNSNVAIPYNPNHINYEIERLDEDLMPITGLPANQIFQSNVPRLSAHKLAILGSQYRSSKYKRGNPVERRIIRNSLRESKELKKIQREEINRIMNPSPSDIVPTWAKRKTEDKTLKYSLIGVLIFLAVAAICVPLMWKFGDSDDKAVNETTTMLPSVNFTTASSTNLTFS